MSWHSSRLIVASAGAVAVMGVAIGVAAADAATHRLSGDIRLVLHTTASSTVGGTASSGSAPTAPTPAVATGTFSISGAIRDEGSFILAAPPPRSPGSPASSSLNFKLTGKRGSLRLRVTVIRAITSGSNFVQVSASQSRPTSWRIVSGTGSYAHLHGAGDARRTGDLLVLTGAVRSA